MVGLCGWLVIGLCGWFVWLVCVLCVVVACCECVGVLCVFGSFICCCVGLFADVGLFAVVGCWFECLSVPQTIYQFASFRRIKHTTPQRLRVCHGGELPLTMIQEEMSVNEVKAKTEGQVKEKESVRGETGCGDEELCNREGDGAVHEVQGLNSESWVTELWLSLESVVKFRVLMVCFEVGTSQLVFTPCDFCAGALNVKVMKFKQAGNGCNETPLSSAEREDGHC